MLAVAGVWLKKFDLFAEALSLNKNPLKKHWIPAQKLNLVLTFVCTK